MLQCRWIRSGRRRFFPYVYMARLLPAVFLLTGGPASSWSEAADEPVRVAYWDILGGRFAREVVEPTVTHLNAMIPGWRFVAVPMGYERLMSAVADRGADFCITDPAVYLEMEAAQGAQRLATVRYARGTQACALQGGVLFCRAGDEAAGVRGLRGRTLATAHHASLTGWISVLDALGESGLDPAQDLESVLVTGSDEATVAAVLEGRAYAGAVPSGALEQMEPGGGLAVIGLRHLLESDPAIRIPLQVSTALYPGWCMAACDRAPDELVRDVTAALLTMPAAAPVDGGAVAHAGWIAGPSLRPVHECLRRVGMHPYGLAEPMTFQAVLRRYMYWFIAAGAAMVIMALTTSYVLHLNRALNASVHRFRHIVACSGDWIWETDDQGRYTYTSEIVEGMLGYTREEVIGRHQHDFFTSAEREQFKPRAREFYARRERIFRERFRLVTKEGRVAIHETTAEPFFDEKGTLLGYRGVSRDVTKEVRFVRL